MAGILSRLYNYWAQVSSPDVKIFFVGFNKCGTTSIHRLLERAGIRSVHFHAPMSAVNPFNLRRPIPQFSVNLATAIEGRQTEEALRKVLDHYTAFSDLFFFSNQSEIEAVRRFHEFHSIYKHSYFILNDRDPEKWIKSRRQHDGGSLLRRAMHYHSASAETVEDIWRTTRETHVNEVLAHFEGYERFLHFKIDVDKIETLEEFLRPHFRIDSRDWTVENRTPPH